MDRVLEPELMDDALQARAYAQADFSEPHNAYPQLFLTEFKSPPGQAVVLDLGCGPGDVTVRFAKTFPEYEFHAVDGAAAMLNQARIALDEDSDLARRIRLMEGILPELTLPRSSYDVILSSNLLHHLADPQALWRTVRRFGRSGTLVFVTDLFRPESRALAAGLVERYARDEPEILRRDFFNSLLAAFTPEEIRTQLAVANLQCLTVKVTSDRHVIVAGTLH